MRTFPNADDERMMLADAALLESEFEPTSAGHDAACHIKALLSTIHQLRVDVGGGETAIRYLEQENEHLRRERDEAIAKLGLPDDGETVAEGDAHYYRQPGAVDR